MMTSLFQRQSVSDGIGGTALSTLKGSFYGSETHEGEVLDDNRSQRSEKFIATQI